MGHALRLLLVEDDREAAGLLVERFCAAGVDIVHAADGAAGLAAAQAGGFDVLVVDRMMPQLDGLAMVKQLRDGGDTTPVLFLSALGEVDDRVDGFAAGADDYLVKPYAFAELEARVTALARRASSDTRLQLGGLVLDVAARSAMRDGRALDLNPREFDLLAFFMRRSGRLVTRSMLLEEVWNMHAAVETNVVDVHISRLRGKLDKGFDTPLLHTKRGEGFILQETAP